MKDIKEFEKLFKINIPVYEHADYYLDTLKKSSFFAGIRNAVSEFEQYEEEILELGYKSAKSYKLDYALPKIKEYISKTYAYEKVNSFEFSNEDLKTKDELRKNDGAYLMSVDFKAANYSVVKSFDEDNELFSSWEELCVKMDIHKTLSKSKSFRQYVFGNLNPKRLQKIQKYYTNKIVNCLIDEGCLKEEDFVFVSHDEFIVKLSSDQNLAINRIYLINSEVGKIISRENINIPTHHKVIKNDGIGSGMYIQTQYKIKEGAFSESHRVLFKVPGNKFFKYFKKFIINEPLDKRDLMFISDGEIAIWNEDEDSN